MDPGVQEDPVYNLTGALIFSAYVASALWLSLLIVRDLVIAHRRQSASNTKSTNGRVGNHVQIFSALSVLSFSILSYFMLKYLIISYRIWAEEQGLPLPQSFLGNWGSQGNQFHIWQWLTSSTLFRDFAKTICGTNARFWWTQQALLMTMAWSMFMSFEGRKRSVPHHWAFAFISQILPVSFAQNLFFLALLLNPMKNSKEKIWTPTPVIQLLPLLAYYIFVLAVPFLSGTGALVTVVVIIRILLFSPLALPAILPAGGVTSYQTPRGTRWKDPVPFGFITICSALLFAWQSIVALRDSDYSLGNLLGAVNESPAVSALGYDYVLSLISSAIWTFTIGNDLT